MFFDFSEEEIIGEVKNLMNDERIRPEPEFQCFSKYFAIQSRQEFLNNEEIFNLTESHGVELKNEIRYWLHRSLINNSDEHPKVSVPVLDPKHLELKSYDDILNKVKTFPTEWTVVQITKKFSIFDILRRPLNNQTPEIFITRFACGKSAERVQPYSVSVDLTCNSIDNLFNTVKKLGKTRREYFSLQRTNYKLSDDFYNTNTELMNFLKELEDHFLKHWACLLQGKLENANLEKKTLSQVKKLVDKFCEKEKLKQKPTEREIDIIYLLTLSAHFMKTKDMFNLLKSLLCKQQNESVNGALMLLLEDLKILNITNEYAIKRAKYNPVILILDNEFENIPWEMTSSLLSKPVCRISSFHLLNALFKYHEPFIEKGLRVVEIDSIYSLINPDGDLELCAKQMREFLKKRIPWAEMDIGLRPLPGDLLTKFERYSSYLYCGHGSGAQYLKVKKLKETFVRGLVFLFGCSSNLPKNCGGITPPQNSTYTYITNGCPCIIGCIQDVSSTDADAACEEMLSNCMPSIINKDLEMILVKAKEPNILKALTSARNACNRFWSKCAFVARGIPCKTIVGDVDTIISRAS